MLDKSKFELRVGVFVFFALLAFIYIVFSIGDFYVFEPGYRVDFVFNYGDGIEVSSPVRYAGVEVGRVENIDIIYDTTAKKNKIRLIAWIEKSAGIEKDSEAYINTLGLLGEKYLEVLPGNKGSGMLQDQDVLVGRDSIPVEKIKQEGYDIAMEAKKTFKTVNEVMTKLNEGEGTMGKLLAEDKIHQDLEALVEDLKNNPWKLLHKPKKSRRTKKKKSR